MIPGGFGLFGRLTVFARHDFAAEGWGVSTKLWDPLRYVSRSAYADSDKQDGNVVNAEADHLALRADGKEVDSLAADGVGYEEVVSGIEIRGDQRFKILR